MDLTADFFAHPSKTKSETKGHGNIACSHSGSPSAIFVPEVFRNVLTIFITAAFLYFLQGNTRFSSHMEGLEELGMLTNDTIHSESCHGCWLVDNSSNHILQLYSKCFLKIRTLGMLRSKFVAILTREPLARFLYLFMYKKSHIVKFADIWNAFIISLREEDLLSNRERERERDLLIVPSSGGDTSVFQSPPLLLVSKIPIALDMAKSVMKKDEELIKRIKQDPYTEVVDRICDSIEDSIQRRSLVREFRLDELPQLSAKFDELLGLLLKTDYDENDPVKTQIANLLQDIMEIITQEIMKNGQGILKYEGRQNQLFANINLESLKHETWREKYVPAVAASLDPRDLNFT
ncbi:hypothetical protein ACP4OV_010495 [Aristida adscensionis]